MKPLRLTVAAFGPYVEEQEIDFAVLRGNSLFLLTGPTGSGKTMLLDAMCCALFGVCSGAARKEGTVRSHLASPQQETRIVFDFAIGAETYRIERKPEQERAKKRGSGTTKEEATAILWCRTEAEDGEGEVLESQPRRVTAKVESLLGFTADQFRQVTVLPQGEFQRFLQADTKEREQILEVLFQTGEFKRIEEALRARSAAAQRAWESRCIERDAILSQAEAASRGDIAARRDEFSERQAALRDEAETLRARSNEARDALEAGRHADRRLKELSQAETAWDALAAANPGNERRKAELELARKAALIVPLEDQAAARAAEARERGSEAAKADAALTSAEAAWCSALAAFEAEERREPERQEARSIFERLRGLTGKVEQLEKCRAAAEAARRTHEEAAAVARSAAAAAASCAARIEQARAELARSRQAAAPLASLQLESERLDAALKLRNELDAAELKRAAADGEAGAKTQARAAADGEVERAQTAAEEARLAWIEGQAARLAAELRAGEPCPVCGSTAHPAPARSGLDVQSDAAFKRASKELDRVRSQRDSAVAAEHDSRVALAQWEAAADAQRKGLGEWSGVPAGEIARRAHQARETLTRTAEQARRADSFEATLSKLTAKEQTLRAAREKAETRANEAAGTLAGAEALFETRLADVPEPLRVPGALSREISAGRAAVERMEAALENTRRVSSKAAEHRAAACTGAERAANSANEAANSATAARTAFEAASAAAGFASTDEFRSARRPASQIDLLDRETRRFESDLKAAEDRLRRSREQAEGLRPPDLPALESWVAEAQEKLEVCLNTLAGLGSRAAQATSQLAAFDRLSGECAALEARHRAVARIANTACGDNNERITFQSFVQATELDCVLQAASERLRAMSKGRYQLQRAAGTLDRRRLAGLELEVFDSHTGASRRVSTLSGGEGFQASLALALGLADTVQNHSGGIHLESIFIDEGFGSLDPDALALAMDTLRELQQGGRLIGIISHVAELREQIPARLEVTPQRRGSTVRFAFE